MAAYDVKVTSKGQVTLPVEIRRMWDLKPGQKIAFYVDEERAEVRVRRRNLPASALFGMFAGAKRAPGLESDDDGIALAVAERDARSRSKKAAE